MLNKFIMDDIILTNTKTNLIELVPKKKAIYLLYYQKYRVPLDEELDTNKITRDDIKVILSKINNVLPLFSEVSSNLILVKKEDIYRKVTFESYRFPNIAEILKKYNDETEKKLVIGDEYKNIEKDSIQYKFYGNLYLNERINKFKTMLNLLNQFNIDILNNTFLNIILDQTNIVGKNLTLCVRPSFTPYFSHLKPYYTRNELIKLAMNMQINTEINDDSSSDEILQLCKSVVDNDISEKILLSHNDYIIKSKKIGLIQFYTLNGSAEISRYLRNPFALRNLYYESFAKSLYNLIINAPALNNNYTIYRFINNDDYLKKYNIGDNYITVNPESYTRNPFFGKDKLGMFGNILIKLNIPKGIPGICLSVETLSHYKSEEEILVCQGSALTLKSKDTNVKYFRPDELENNVITTRYEFDYHNSTAFRILGRRDNPRELQLINFLELYEYDTIKPITIDEKMSLFIYQYANENKQFKTIIGEKEYVVSINEYDSTLSTYSRFYAIKNSKGYFMSTMIDNNYGFAIEIGEVDNQICVHANYILKYTTISGSNWINRDDLLHFISCISCYFESKRTYIHSEYMSCDYNYDHRNKLLLGGNYNIEFYKYFKTGKLAYEKYTDYIIPLFNIKRLEQLKTTNSELLFSKYDEKDELYQLHKLLFITVDEYKTVGSFYNWLVENWGIHIKSFLKRLNNILPNKQNPFTKDCYVFDIYRYLYDNNHIDQYYGDELEFMSDITYSRNTRFEVNSLNRVRGNNDIINRNNRFENEDYTDNPGFM